MMQSKKLFPMVILLSAWLPAARPAAAQDDTELRVYPVADLLVPTPSHPYRGDGLPTVGPEGAGRSLFGQMTAQTGDTGGGFGGGVGGGGFFAVGGQPDGQTTAPQPAPQHAAAQPASPRPDMNGLIDLLYAAVDPSSWDRQGGEARCVPFGTMLVVRQTVANHEKIAALLDAIRSGGGAAKTVLVEAYWLLLDSDQLGSLAPNGTAGSGQDRTAVDPGVLEKLTREVPSFRGQITCFSGQTVHVVAGSRRAVVTGAIAMVGGAAAYQPLMANPNIGVLLEVTPWLLPGADAAVLDLESTVTGWREPGPPVQIGGTFPPQRRVSDISGQIEETPAGVASITVDRVHMPTQALATTVRVPLGKPALVGGLTLDPTDGEISNDAGERKQLYLVVQGTAGNDD